MGNYSITIKNYTCRNNERSLNLLCEIYLIGTFMLFALMNTQNATSFEQIVVPHISRLVIYFHVFFTIIIVFFILFHSLCFNIKLKFDTILILLFVRCATDAISHILNIENSTEKFFGFYANTVIAFTVYFVFLQVSNFNRLKVYFAFFIILISIQTIWTMISININYFDLTYKSYINIPYGGSNIIASLLVPGFFLTFFIKSKWKYIYAIIVLFAVVATKSRGGLFLLVGSLFVYGVTVKSTSAYASIRKFLLVLLLIFILLLLFFSDVGKEFILGYSSSTNLNEITSGRLKIFLNDFLEALNKPLFGHGLGYGYTNQVGSHNLFIDLLYKCGFIGLSIYVLALILLFKNFNRTSEQKFYLVFIIIMLINSMFEVCYFSYKCDAIFWLTAGIFSSINYCNIEKNIIPRC